MKDILKPPFISYATMFANDAQSMAGDAYAWAKKRKETGGCIHGLWSHSGRLIIMLASPAGPKVCRETTHFAEDPDHVTLWNEKLQERFGIQYAGNWHSHHRLGLDHPSRGDGDQIHRLAARCNIPRMVQLILTYEDEAISLPGTGSIGQKTLRSLYKPVYVGHEVSLCNKVKPKTSASCSKIRISAFIYNEAPKGGSCARIPLNVIPYPNPIRTALAGSEILQVPNEKHVEDFPLDRIVYDELNPAEESNGTDHDVPPVLIKQLNELPDEIANCTEIYTETDLVLISLPLSNGYRVCVAYNIKKPVPKIHSVHLIHPHSKITVDITNDILTYHDASLRFIYKRSEDMSTKDEKKMFFKSNNIPRKSPAGL